MKDNVLKSSCWTRPKKVFLEPFSDKPKSSRDQAEILAQIKDLLLMAFNKDYSRYDAWLLTPNPLFEGRAPMDFIRNGEADKILGIIQASLKNKIRIEV